MSKELDAYLPKPFEGEYSVKIDPKRRIHIPVRWQELQPGDKTIIFHRMGRAGAFLWEQLHFERTLDNLGGLNHGSKVDRAIKRLLYPNIYESKPDKMGRIILPKSISPDGEYLTLSGQGNFARISQPGEDSTVTESIFRALLKLSDPEELPRLRARVRSRLSSSSK
jgi:DNA-binding transcriptional regulator/RsmH inhibitor MraZ